MGNDVALDTSLSGLGADPAPRGADVAEAVIELQLQQIAYEAALQALTRVLPPSLASFLR